MERKSPFRSCNHGALTGRPAKKNTQQIAPFTDCRYMNIFRHLVFPEKCPACDVTAISLCRPCREGLEPWDPACCLRCGADRFDRCFCSFLPFEVDTVESVWRFDGAITDVIEYAKYRGELWRVQRLKTEIAACIAPLRLPDGGTATVTAVPPTWRRLRKRGFDLATVLASWCSSRGENKLDLRLLQRTGRRPSRQATYGRQQRFDAVKGAFVARPAPSGVILVDDVITTGATASACARALVRSGARHVRIISLARTPSWETKAL